MKQLIDIVAKLRSPAGCPWDKKQDHNSLIPFLLEETWEVIDEIKKNALQESLKDELGDLLLQVVLHAQIAAEDDRFTIADVVDAICQKMIDRHPHVFGEQSGRISAESQNRLWHQRKIDDKKHDSVLDGISNTIPALISSLKIGQRAASVGFDWEKPEDVLVKIKEEIDEVEQEMKSGNTPGIEEEIGDLLFSITNLARFYHINPEVALKKGNDKFKSRFKHVESKINDASKQGITLSPEEMDSIWNATK